MRPGAASVVTRLARSNVRVVVSDPGTTVRSSLPSWSHSWVVAPSGGVSAVMRPSASYVNDAVQPVSTLVVLSGSPSLPGVAVSVYTEVVVTFVAASWVPVAAHVFQAGSPSSVVPVLVQFSMVVVSFPFAS